MKEKSSSILLCLPWFGSYEYLFADKIDAGSQMQT